MATAVASAIPLPPPVSTGQLSTARQTSTADPADPFQNVLAEATTSTADTRATLSAQAADDAGKTEAAVKLAEAEDADRLADEALAAELAGLLAASAQAGVPTDNTPVNFAEEAALAAGQVTGTAVEPGGATPDQATTTPPTRSNPLFRQFVSEAGTQNNTRLPAPVTKETPPTEPAVPPPVVPRNVAPAVSAVPLAPTGLPSAVAAVQPAQRQVVTAQAPIMPGLLPNQPETGATATPTPVVAPQAPIAATAVPEARLGDRPGTAGDQFAAIASAASTLPRAPNVVAATNEAQPVSTFGAVLTSVPTLLPNAVPAPTTVLADGITANATAAPPVLARVPELVEPPTSKTDSGDASRLSGFGTGLPQPFSPNAPSAPAAASATVQPPAVQVADGVITHAHLVERGGTTEFHIRLDPPDLGPVRIRLVNNGDGINGQVVVSDDAVRRMIESQLPELRQRLEAAGVTVQSFNVSTDTNSGAGSGGRSDAPPVFGTQSATTSASRLPPRPSARGPGLLDVMA